MLLLNLVLYQFLDQRENIAKKLKNRIALGNMMAQIYYPGYGGYKRTNAIRECQYCYSLKRKQNDPHKKIYINVTK